ncbi:MAG TPA: amino acid racemase [Roseococcus sp.]|jgi:aspartate racemase|nr:amino acid racemase [Roseococcus sp.]
MMLGVLGGMGPLASADFMRQLTLLTPAERDQDHVPAMLWSDPRVPDRTLARLAGGEDPLPALLRGLRALEAAGCGVIAIPCNTAHGWYDALQATCPLPILHIVEAARRDLDGIEGPVGLLGTAATLEMGLYQRGLQRECLLPDAATMERLVTPGIALVKANRVAEAHAPLAQAARRLRERGAAAVVLGCTEIPLGIAAGPPLGFPVVDTVAALARAAIRHVRGG